MTMGQVEVEDFKSAIRQLNAEEGSKWSFDRHIPIALIITLLGTGVAGLGSGVYYVATMQSRIDGLEMSSTARTADVKEIGEEQVKSGNRLTAIETKLDSVLDLIRRLDTNAMGKK